MELFERIQEAQERWNVLRHPFYVRWEEGELSRQSCRRTPASTGTRSRRWRRPRETREPLARDGHAAEEAAHVTLWDAWATSLGADPAEPSAETAGCAEAWAPADPLAATAVLYRGRVGAAGDRGDEAPRAGRALRLPARLARDLVLPGARRAGPRARRPGPRDPGEQAGDADEDRLVAAAEGALRANWELLDGVERLNGAALPGDRALEREQLLLALEAAAVADQAAVRADHPVAGSTIGIGFRFIIVPTARAARGLPACAASAP